MTETETYFGKEEEEIADAAWLGILKDYAKYEGSPLTEEQKEYAELIFKRGFKIGWMLAKKS